MHYSQLIFSNVFTQYPVENIRFLTTTTSDFINNYSKKFTIIIIIGIISCPCVFFMMHFIVHS